MSRQTNQGAASGAHQNCFTVTSSQLYLFGDTFLSETQALSSVRSNRLLAFFSFQDLAACLPFVAQFPDEIIILWLLCSFIIGSQNRTLHQFGARGQRACVLWPFSHCSSQMRWHRDRIPGSMEEAVEAIGPGLRTWNSSPGINSLFYSPAHQLFIDLFIHLVNIYRLFPLH